MTCILSLNVKPFNPTRKPGVRFSLMPFLFFLMWAESGAVKFLLAWLKSYKRRWEFIATFQRFSLLLFNWSLFFFTYHSISWVPPMFLIYSEEMTDWAAVGAAAGLSLGLKKGARVPFCSGAVVMKQRLGSRCLGPQQQSGENRSEERWTVGGESVEPSEEKNPPLYSFQQSDSDQIRPHSFTRFST